MPHGFGEGLNTFSPSAEREALGRKKREFLTALFPSGVPEKMEGIDALIINKLKDFTTVPQMNFFEQNIKNTFTMAAAGGRKPTVEEIAKVLEISPDQILKKNPPRNSATFQTNQLPPGQIRPLGDSIAP